MRMGNLLIYSATVGNSCIWPLALPRSRPCRGPRGRKPIRRGWCGSSSPFLPAKQATPSRGSWVNRCRSGSPSHSSSRTERAPAAISAPKASCGQRPTAIRSCSWAVERDERDALQEAQFQFHPRNSAGREHRRRPLRHGGQFIRSSQDGPGVHRLRQGQSQQDQHGIVRQRVHVPYRGGYVPDLLSGQVQVVFGTISSCIQYIRGGMLRALAVTTLTRSDVLPEIPTLAEFVPGYEASQWYGIGAPKDTPAEVIGKLNTEINAVTADPLIKARLAGLGVDPMSMTSAAFGTFIADEAERWGKVIRTADIKAE